MQATLLSIAIAIILALVTALVGPFLVDFGRYRAEFETQASRLAGQQVRIAGPIDVRLLPTPTLTLQNVEIDGSDASGVTRVRRFAVEFSLNAAIRGELRASNMRLDGAEFAVGLDGSGRFVMPISAIGREPNPLAIGQLDVANSRATFTDAGGSRIVLDKFEFGGEVSSLAGPAKGEGSFSLSDQAYQYRLSAGHRGGDGAVRVRLALSPADRSLSADVDGSIWLDRGAPRYDGNLQLVRPLRRDAAGAHALATEPWRVTSRISGDTASATFEQVELAFGQDDRAMRLRGSAKLRFGDQRRMTAVLSAPQIDVDRVLALSEETRRHPAIAAGAVADFLAELRPRFPVDLRLSVDNLAFAGGTLQRLNGEVRGDADAWNIQSLEFRAPGSTQVRLSGRLSVGSEGVVFAGPTQVEASNPRLLVAWLNDRADIQASAGPFRAEGVLKIGGGSLEIDRLAADFGRTALKGRGAYSWPTAAHAARLDASLSASEIDLDFAYALAQNLFADTRFEWPREGAIALTIGKASVAGMAAERADVSVRFDRQLINIDRLAIAEFGGAAVVAKGSIDARTLAPHGAMTLDLEARAFDGVIALLDKIAPRAADQLRRSAGNLAPARLSASLALNSDNSNAPDRPASGTLRIDGRAGAVDVSLTGEAEMPSGTDTLASLAKLDHAKAKVVGRFDAANGRPLLEVIGLDRLVTVDKAKARLDLTAAGPLDGEMTVTGRLVAGGLDVSADGTLQSPGAQAMAASLALRVAASNAKTWRPEETLPITLSTRLTLSGHTADLADLTGQVGGTGVDGHLAIDLTQPLGVRGDIKLGTVDLPAAIAAATGLPPDTVAAPTGWSAEPFKPNLLGSMLGQLAINTTQVGITRSLAARDVRGNLNFNRSGVAFDDIDGAFAGGRITGRLGLAAGTDGVTAHGRVRLEDADMAALIPGEARPPFSGRLVLDAEFEGSGRSPTALVGSLKGGGSFALRDGAIAGLDPAAFGGVIRSVDDGLSVEPSRIRDRMESLMARGALAVRLAEGAIKIGAGRVQLNNAVLRGEGADPTLTASVDLAEKTITAKLTLIGSAALNEAGGAGPEIAINLSGPVDAPKRATDVTALSSWLALRAVGQQAKRLAAIEAARGAPSTNAPPVANPNAPAVPPRSPEQRQSNLTTSTPATGSERPAAPPPRPPEQQQSNLNSATPAIGREPSVAPPASPKPQPATVPESAAAPDDPAIRELDKAIAENPRNAAALYKRGQLLALKADFGRAITDFNEVIRLEPRNAEALNNRCWARAIVGDPQVAMKDCNEALQIRPRFADALDSRGFVHLKIGQSNNAIADYDAVLRVNPKQASSLYGRGIAKLRSGNTADAMNDIAAAKTIQPNIAEEFASYGVR